MAPALLHTHTQRHWHPTMPTGRAGRRGSLVDRAGGMKQLFHIRLPGGSSNSSETPERHGSTSPRSPRTIRRLDADATAQSVADAPLDAAATLPHGIQSQSQWESAVELLETAPSPELRHFALTCMLRHTSFLQDQVSSASLRARVASSLADVARRDLNTANTFVATYLLGVVYATWGVNDVALAETAWEATLRCVLRAFPDAVARMQSGGGGSRRSRLSTRGTQVQPAPSRARRRRSSAVVLQGLIAEPRRAVGSNDEAAGQDGGRQRVGGRRRSLVGPVPPSAVRASSSSSASRPPPTGSSLRPASAAGEEGEEADEGCMPPFRQLQQRVWALGALGQFLREADRHTMQYALCETLLCHASPLSRARSEVGVSLRATTPSSSPVPSADEAVLLCEVLRCLRLNMPDSVESRYRVQPTLSWVYAFARHLVSDTCRYPSGLRRHAVQQVSLFTSRW